MNAFSLIKKIEDRMHPPTPLKERISHASFKLHTQLEKLEQMYSRLQQRDRDLFQRCVGAQVSNDSAHSKIYANECAEIRKIAKVVLGSQLALEKVILRLETVEEFGDIMNQMAPVMGIVKETKSQIAGVVPQVASELDEVNNMLEDLSTETGDVTTTSLPIEATDDEAKKVLQETGLIAEQRLREHFPDLPDLPITNTPSEDVTIPESATAASVPNGNFPDQLLGYIKSHGQEFSVTYCAKELGRSPEEVRSALDQLRESGRVVIE